MQLISNIQIIGWGDVPSRDQYQVDNAEVLRRIISNVAASDTTSAETLNALQAMTPQGVTDKLGIATRQYFTDHDSTELARIAAENALERASINDPNFHREKVHLIVSGGSTPDDLYPGCAPRLQHLLGIPDAEAFDMSSACCSGSQALIEATRALQIGYDQYALVAIGETIGSRCNDLMDENGLLWGDGGSAIVIRSERSNKNFGIQAFVSRSDGLLSGTTRSRGLGTHPDHRRFPALNASMEGRGTDIYRWVVGTAADRLKEFLEINRLKVDDRTFLLPHNGNLRMVLKVGATIGLRPDQVLNRIAERGNQSSASVFSTLAHYADQGLFQHGDQLILATFGGGVIYNFIIYRWV